MVFLCINDESTHFNGKVVITGASNVEEVGEYGEDGFLVEEGDFGPDH